MEFFKQNTRIDFMALRKSAAVISIAIMLISTVALVVNGLNWGLEFTGGTEVVVTFPKAVDLNEIRQQLAENGHEDVVVQAYGTSRTVLLRVPGKDTQKNAIGSELLKVLPDARLQSNSYIGPQVGKELATSGALALFVALIGTAIYITVRFEYRFAVSATVALIHDPIIILGCFAYLHIPFDLISLAAILTVIGYSLNDTVVVFDRVRENFRKMHKSSPDAVINISVNQTLSRTIITSGLTLLAVLSLFIFGGPTLHGFALALLVGIVVGTYSSIYVAGALAVALGLNRQDMLPTPKGMLDEMP